MKKNIENNILKRYNMNEIFIKKLSYKRKIELKILYERIIKNVTESKSNISSESNIRLFTR